MTTAIVAYTRITIIAIFTPSPKCNVLKSFIRDDFKMKKSGPDYVKLSKEDGIWAISINQAEIMVKLHLRLFNSDIPKILHSGYISALFIVYKPSHCVFTVINMYFSIDNQHLSGWLFKNGERNLPLDKR